MAPQNGLDDGEGNKHTVFIDTSLDTHLAIIVSDSDTVSDLKKKIMLEHCQCFPAIGDIKIHCLKMKLRGKYYHLSDSMLVKSAFVGAGKNLWLLSVDASHLEKQDGVQHSDKDKAGDQLALPWATDSRLIERHNTHEDGPSKLSLFHGSPSMHHKIVPFVDQKVPSVDQFTSDDSCKKNSKNIEEDRSSHDNHCRNVEPDSEKKLDSKVEENLDSVNKEIKSKKRIRDVHNEGLTEDALGDGPSVKKRLKTEVNVKALEEDRVLTDDTNKVKSMNDENSIEEKSKDKDATLDDVVTKSVNDDHTTTMLVSRKKIKKSKKVKKKSAHDQVATVVPSIVEDVAEEKCLQKNTEASEVIADVATVVENNIQQEMPLHDELEEHIQKPTDDLETHVGASNCENEDQLLDNLVVDVSLTVPTPIFDEKVVDEEKNDVSGVVSEKTLKDNDLIPESTETHKEKSRKERSRTKKRSVSKKNESNDAATITKEETFETKESQDTARKTSELNAECIKENSEKQNEKMDEKKKRKKKSKKSSARNEDEPLTELNANGDLHENVKEIQSALLDSDRKDVSEAGDKVAQVSDEGLVKEIEKNPKSSDLPTEPEKSQHLVPLKETSETFETKESQDTARKTSELNEECIKENPEKQNEKMDETKKKKRKKKSKKSSARNEDEPITELNANDDLHENVKEIQSALDSDRKDVSEAGDKVAQVSDEGLVKETEKNPKSSDLPTEPEKSQHLVLFEETSKNVTLSQVSKNMDDGKTEADNPSEIDFKHYFTPGGNLKKKVPKKKPNEKDDNGVKQSLIKDENNKALLSLKKTLEVSTDVVKYQNNPNVNNFKTPKTGKIDSPKKNTPVVRSLFKTGRTIFGDDSDNSSADDNDNAAVNSYSTTRTPSSSEQSASSIDSRRHGFRAVKRKESDEKNNMNSQSKKMSMADLLRSSSRFKKARVTASQQVMDTESEPVDFVPESQLNG